jgi:hypothetical protein
MSFLSSGTAAVPTEDLFIPDNFILNQNTLHQAQRQQRQNTKTKDLGIRMHIRNERTPSEYTALIIRKEQKEVFDHDFYY